MARSASRSPMESPGSGPGYDGSPPEFREARDVEGKGKRAAELGPQNIRVDRLEWLLAHRRIDVAQHAAGRRLQHDSDIAEIRGGGRMCRVARPREGCANRRTACSSAFRWRWIPSPATIGWRDEAKE